MRKCGPWLAQSSSGFASWALRHVCNSRVYLHSVFVFAQKPARMQSMPNEYIVEHAFPLIPSFSISMSQPRQMTLDLSSPPPGSTFALDQPRTGTLLIGEVLRLGCGICGSITQRGEMEIIETFNQSKDFA